MTACTCLDHDYLLNYNISLIVIYPVTKNVVIDWEILTGPMPDLTFECQGCSFAFVKGL